jgi:2-polyprenyl-3-methyl-5-hydroxy-6-metoxy-1,4-benzoquinol methylase
LRHGQDGETACGIELNNVQVDFIREKFGITCYDSDLDVSMFGENKFDVVYHCDILSHLYDPIEELSKMNKIIKDDGILVFETGNVGDVEEGCFDLFESFQYPDHLFFFGEKSLDSLLRSTGFEMIEIYRYSILPHLLIFLYLKKVINIIKS